MQILQTNRFKKAYKKFHPNQLEIVNKTIKTIINNPKIGEQKKGDLFWLRVYKFKIKNQLILLGYTLKENKELIMILVSIASHENFYRDLKNS